MGGYPDLYNHLLGAMRYPIVIAIVLAAILAAIGISWGMRRAREQRDPFEDMKAGVTQTSGPLAVSAARSGCPISLPESATNIEYAVWSLWRASQTFVRFEAPASDCLKHARTILQPHAQRAGVSIAYTNIVGPLVPPVVVSPKDLSIPWFDLPRFSAGVVFEVSGGQGPAVWVDTNRGCFYYAWNK